MDIINACKAIASRARLQLFATFVTSRFSDTCACASAVGIAHVPRNSALTWLNIFIIHSQRINTDNLMLLTDVNEWEISGVIAPAMEPEDHWMLMARLVPSWEIHMI
jgi:hypothetical protein